MHRVFAVPDVVSSSKTRAWLISELNIPRSVVFRRASITDAWEHRASTGMLATCEPDRLRQVPLRTTGHVFSVDHYTEPSLLAVHRAWSHES
jgi:hypothetical protein